MKVKEFAVSAQTMSLYDAFRKEAEARGWELNSVFGEGYWGIKESCNCLYFSDSFTPSNNPGFLQFGFSNSSHRIPLETNWNDAIALLEQESTPDIITVSLQEIASWKKCDIENIRIKL